MISKTKINKEAQRKNQELKELIFLLKKKKETLALARYLALPKRKAIHINLDKINKFSQEGESIVIPGKVLGKGELKKKIELYAFKISDKARLKLKESGSSFKNLKQLKGQFKIIK